MEGADHQNTGCGDHRRAGGVACRHHHRHHLRSASSEEQGHLLHKPAAHQHQREGLRLLLRQGEWGGVTLTFDPCGKIWGFVDVYSKMDCYFGGDFI